MGNDTRNTKYSTAIADQLTKLQHATNAELLHALRQEFPELSATTVHRATARLAERGVIGTAPATQDGSMRYDANTSPHDHFVCLGCSTMRDLDVATELIPKIEESLGGCKISGRLLVSGTCKRCLENECNGGNI